MESEAARSEAAMVPAPGEDAMKDSTFVEERDRMVAQQIEPRGVTDARITQAMRTVPRERFVGEEMAEFAFEDAPLPIEEGQTISQPFIVALMIDALDLQGNERVLEVGAGSGYAAAVLSRITTEVYAVEVHRSLADSAAERLRDIGYENVHVRCADGTQGWAEHAPYDAILVSAGGPEIPESLLRQLAVGGRLVVPVGRDLRSQELLLVTRTGEQDYEHESLGAVQFVPLVGTEGWAADGTPAVSPHRPEPTIVAPPERRALATLIAEEAEPLASIDDTAVDALVDRVGDARVVLIGEASHGTSEFYRMRARITQELIRAGKCDLVALEADWPDTRALDGYVRGRSPNRLRVPPFSRFPSWMWRNSETRDFVDWLVDINRERPHDRKISLHGLDLYSLNNSIGAVLAYLERVDPEAAEAARVRYSCFSPWEMDPTTYGRAAISGRMESCENDAIETLRELLQQRIEYLELDGDEFYDAERNATVVRDAERYYRTMYYGSRESWNLRDQHMFDTLLAALDHRGSDARAVVWAHNSHVGDARATEMSARGELNIGQLCREHFGERSYSIGFGTHHGQVAAAQNWDAPMEIMDVRPSHEDSYERLCHESSVEAFLLHLRDPKRSELRDHLRHARLQRAIGVIYRPESELLSHYFQASLPAQFDEYVWFDETAAVRALETGDLEGVPETYPFGL
jgi:protein-L-isoaspartate(D-aspartate) O-methyltransferase